MALNSNPNTVIVNGEPIAITGKVKYKRGAPKITVKTATVGDTVKTYEDADYTEAVSSTTFSIQPTKANIERLEDWQDNVGKNGIRFVDNRDGFTKTIKGASIMEDPEIDFTAEIEIVFTGGQAV